MAEPVNMVASKDPAAAEQLAKQYAGSLQWLIQHGLHAYVKGAQRLARNESHRMLVRLHNSPSMVALIQTLSGLFKRLGIEQSGFDHEPTESELPMIAIIPQQGYRIVYGRAPTGEWLFDSPTGRGRADQWPEGTQFTAAHAMAQIAPDQTAKAMFYRVIKTESDSKWVRYAVLSSLLAAVLALATSFYSMQVYDRVIGSGSMSTLTVLTIGVLIAIVTEFGVKLARAAIIDRAAQELDQQCAYDVFSRLTSVRLDQKPQGVGNLASQVRSYESIRGFGVNFLLFVTSDGPFSLLFVAVIFLIGGPFVGVIPLIFIALSVFVGLLLMNQIEQSTQKQITSGNRRQGLLVEAIEGAETLKASGGTWHILGKWNELSKQYISESMKIKHLNDFSSYTAATLQQISYIVLVAIGAWVATSTMSITLGAIIACSILSGRALAPVSMIPGLLVQWANAKISLQQLEEIYRLERENHGIDSPLVPQGVAGRLELENIKFVYQGQVTALSIDKLSIQAGEKVAILGPIGSGKSTLLRVMAGLMKPQRGQVLVDGLDVQQISADRRTELLGYLSQRITLIGGTLRENLLMGLPPISEKDVLAACEATGLAALISSRSEGLDLPILEGGVGLSGGQIQMIAFTRMILSRPSVWLLDEPTASMDDMSEARCFNTLTQYVGQEQTMVLVTHKTQLLRWVNRIIVLTPKGIMLDGPRDAVLAKLTQPPQQAQQAAQAQQQPQQAASPQSIAPPAAPSDAAS